MKLFTYKTCSRFRTHCYPACKHYVIFCILKLHDKTNPFLYIYIVFHKCQTHGNTDLERDIIKLKIALIARTYGNFTL